VKAVVLAAGYATRLYPLTRDRPKALLPVGGKPMLEHLLERLDEVPGLDEIHVVTNSKFAAAFREWAGGYGAGAVRILDDGTNDEETKLGAIGDLDLTIRSAEIDDDLLVLAGDNLFSESLAPFVEFGRSKGAPALGVYDVGDLEAIRRYNAIELDEDDRVTFFEEKPERPTSTLTGIALYLYPRSRSSASTWLRATTRISRDAWWNGSTPGRMCTHGAFRDGGTTWARRKRSPRPTVRSRRGTD